MWTRNVFSIPHSGHKAAFVWYSIIEQEEYQDGAILRQSMSRKGNCWDNAPQESFFGHMKDSIKDKLKEATGFTQIKAIIDDYIDYYNNDRYQWQLAKLSPNE